MGGLTPSLCRKLLRYPRKKVPPSRQNLSLIHILNEEIEYSDDEQNEVKFPDPKVYVDCGEVVHPEPEPEPVEFSSGPCEEQVCYDCLLYTSRCV